MSDNQPEDEGVGCRPLVEAFGVFVLLLVVGVIAAFGTDPASIGSIRAFLFFLGAPATTALQFISPDGFPLAWPIDVVVWVLAAFWAARADDRRGWAIRVGLAVGAAAVLALLAIRSS